MLLTAKFRGVSWSKKRVSVLATAPETHPCAAGYSGWLGVVPKGVHDGSGNVSGLASISPFWIAVTGLQKLKAYFAFMHPMKASVYPVHNIAKRRAEEARSNCFSVASWRSVLE